MLLRAAIMCGAVITVPVRHTFDLKQVPYLSAGQCLAYMTLEAINFLYRQLHQISSDFKNFFKAESAVNM